MIGSFKKGRWHNVLNTINWRFQNMQTTTGELNHDIRWTLLESIMHVYTLGCHSSFVCGCWKRPNFPCDDESICHAVGSETPWGLHLFPPLQKHSNVHHYVRLILYQSKEGRTSPLYVLVSAFVCYSKPTLIFKGWWPQSASEECQLVPGS